MAVDPELRKYLDTFRQSLETRMSLLEREVSELRRNPPLASTVEFAQGQAESACLGVAELQRLFGDLEHQTIRAFHEESQANRELFMTEALKVRGAVQQAATKANDRTRLWVGALGTLGVVLVALIGVAERVSTAHTERSAEVICWAQINRALDDRKEHEKRMVDDAADVAMQKCRDQFTIRVHGK